MRTWTLHPGLLLNKKDCKQYVACWSETLQGLGALLGKHKRHLNHPQLNRFKQLGDIKTLKALNTYLYYFYIDSKDRITPVSKIPFKFDITKIDMDLIDTSIKLPVSAAQMEFEFNHLNNKLIEKGLDKIKEIKIHPMFYIDNNYVDIIEKGNIIIKWVRL